MNTQNYENLNLNLFRYAMKMLLPIPAGDIMELQPSYSVIYLIKVLYHSRLQLAAVL